MKQKIEESLRFIRSATDIVPKGLVIIGTGLSDSISDLDEAVTVSYSHIPHFPIPTAPTHAGELIIGLLGDYPLAVMMGRSHYYEGYSMNEVTFPLRVLRSLGVDTLIITNSAGALNIDYAEGDIVIITDHINLMGVNPLRGLTDDEGGARFAVMSQAYDPAMINRFKNSCIARKIIPHMGVYVAVSGPSLETPAELRYLHGTGADLIGMSTVPEVIVGIWQNMKILGVSVVSNKAVFLPKSPQGNPIAEINRTAQDAARKLNGIFKHFFKGLEVE